MGLTAAGMGSGKQGGRMIFCCFALRTPTSF